MRDPGFRAAWEGLRAAVGRLDCDSLDDPAAFVAGIHDAVEMVEAADSSEH